MKGNKTTKIIAQMASLLSIVNGGIIEAIKKLEWTENSMKLRIQLPGIHAESVKAEVHDNKLTVLYFIESNVDKMRMKIANIVHTQTIPYFVDIKRLTANFSNGILDITMPFNELSKGYNKDLIISS